MTLKEFVNPLLSGKTKKSILFQAISLIVIGALTIVMPHAMEYGFDYAFGTACIIYGSYHLIHAALNTQNTTLLNTGSI